MNTKQMDYVLEVAKTMNFNKAAENLYVSQPTMSYQIRMLEEETGFEIFNRSGKGAMLTPAGDRFVSDIRRIREEIKNAVEDGQNFSAKYLETIRIAMPVRSAVYFLPEAIKRFETISPETYIAPTFDWDGCIESFRKGDQDIVFAREHQVKQMADVEIHRLFDSRFYLITQKDDPLADRSLIKTEDLKGRTLMVGGGSPPILRRIQNRVIAETGIDHFNSRDHDNTLTNVAAGRGVCISPGFLNDHSGEFAWIPFDCSEVNPCALCTHKNDSRAVIKEFIRLIREIYAEHSSFPL